MTPDEQALILKSKTHLETIFDAIADPILIVGGDYAIKRLNRAASKALGKEFPAILGRRCYEEFHGRKTPCQGCPLQRVMAESAAGNLHMERYRRVFDLRYFPLFDKEGGVGGMVEHYVDITDGEAAKAKLESAYLQFREEMTLAQKVQEALLPQRLPDMPGLSVEVLYQPHSDVGGDLYDFFRVDAARWGLLIADVAGHGVPAALICAMAKMSFYLHAPGCPSPKQVFERVNRDLLSHLRTEFYITAFYAVWQPVTRLLRYAWAGHPTPLLFRRATGRVEALKTDGFFLGMVPDSRYAELETLLSPGDRLLFYTDGLTDSRNVRKERFGPERLEAVLVELRDQPLAAVRTEILKRLSGLLAGAESKDDVTFVILEVTP